MVKRRHTGSIPNGSVQRNWTYNLEPTDYSYKILTRSYKKKK